MINERTRIRIASIAMVAALATGCSSIDGTTTSTTSSTTAEPSTPSDTTLVSAVFDSTTVHELSVEVDDSDYDELIAAYVETGSKEWIEATVTIDGTTYSSAGLRLKGNSSLRALGGARGGAGESDGGVTDQSPEDLPWLIRLDKYVDGQNHDGVNDFVIRSNNSETSLNEAVALDLLEAAGLATQDAMAVRFSVNGGETVLRLVIEHPDDVWMADNFSAEGALYKAESTGDYSYRGDDPDAYDELFDQEAGKHNTDLTPLIEFLDFINNTDDETFAAEIDQWLEVDSFATYLAMQDLIQNFDDIDGPGNNSYLYWDPETERFTVVAWDHNLAFGDAGFGLGADGGPGGMGDPGGQTGWAFGDAGERPGQRPNDLEAPAAFEPAEGLEPPAGFRPPGFEPGQAGGGLGGPGAGSNVLVERMTALDEFAELTEARLAELSEALIDSGLAANIVDTWANVLEAGVDNLVSVDTITDDAERLIASLEA